MGGETCGEGRRKRAMAVCSYGNHAGEIVPVSGRFIREYCKGAPAHSVRVYLAGLYMCATGGELAELAACLGLAEEQVKAAFLHWQQQGLVQVQEQPYAVTYLPVPPREAGGDVPQLYPLRELNAQLQQLFAPAVLAPADYRRIYDFMDVYGIAEQAVVLLVGYGRGKMKDAARRTVSAQLNYIEKLAKLWAENGITSVIKAERWLREQEKMQSGIYALMRAMGMHRAPTQAEWKLYESWMEKGFGAAAITAAAERLTGSYAPTFARLDEVVQELSAQGVRTAKGIRAQAQERQEQQALQSEVFAVLGLRNPTPTAAQREQFAAAMARGVTPEMLRYAAQCTAQERGKTTAFYARLARWEKAGAYTLSAAQEVEKARQADYDAALEVYRRLGIARVPEESAVQTVAQNRGNMGEELMFYAAELSQKGEHPVRLWQKIVQDYAEKGVRDVRTARALARKRQEPAQAENPARAYEQRQYTDEELEELFFGKREKR